MYQRSGIFFLILILFTFGTLVGQTPDGYVVAGWTKSYIHGGLGDFDFLIYRLGENGDKRWRKNYGSDMIDAGYSVCQTANGGFGFLGFTYGYSNGSGDMLLYSLNGSGQKLWRKNYGGGASDPGYTVCRTADGGLLIGGNTWSYVNGTPGPGNADFLVYKLDVAGNKKWRKNYGGVKWDQMNTAIQTEDGGYLLVGDSVTYSHGAWDFLLYKIDSTGKKQWRKNYGGPQSDATKLHKLVNEHHGGQAVQTTDGGYIFCGGSEGYTHGGTDFIMYKVDASGAKQWRKNCGGFFNEESTSIRQTADGGYVVAGWTQSYVTGTPGVDIDFLVYKLDAAGNKQWRKNYGGMYQDAGMSILQTADGGYVFAGWSQSYVKGTPGVDSDVLVYKLDANGAKQWRKNFGGSEYDKGYSILEVFK